MSDTYNGLLKELGISKSPDSYETYRQLKEKRAEYMLRMGSQNSPEENRRLEQMLNDIGKAESHFEALAKDEKKANKWDGFDYASLMGQKKKKKRVYMPEVTKDVVEDITPESVLTFEERYDNIIGFMGTPDGFEAGLEQLKQLGEEGYLVAQNRLGLLYYYGEKSVVPEHKEAFGWYEKAAMQGDASSENQIGTMYIQGDGVDSNREKAIFWLKKAAEGGDDDAPWNLGLVYEHYFEIKDYKEAVYWYEIAANDHGWTQAYNKLGLIYMNNNGVGPDRDKAIYWLKKGVEAGDRDAVLNLGLTYEQYFEEKDYKEAVYWYELAVNDYGWTNLYKKLGVIYMNDNGVGPDRDKAIYWLKKSFEVGDKNAAWNLGLLYEQYFEEKDYKEAAYWYEIAANDYGWTQAYNKLGLIYMNNNGAGPNRDKAIYWLEKAAETGEKAAYWNLGLVYENRFEEKDYKKAKYWYEKAMESGDTDAQDKLGYIYTETGAIKVIAMKKYLFWLERTVEAEDLESQMTIVALYLGNEGIEADYDKAILWAEKVAYSPYKDKVYHKGAYNVLGNIFAYILPQKNYDEGIKWYEKAALEYDDSDAMAAIGAIYENKKGDDAQAAEWYLKAIQRGNTDAQKRFDTLTSKIQLQNTKKEKEEKHGAGKLFARWKK